MLKNKLRWWLVTLFLVGVITAVAVGLQQLAWASCSAGGCVQTNYAAIVRVCYRDASGRVFGSGVVVWSSDERLLVLTCAHLFEQPNGQINVFWPTGASFSGTLAALDRSSDLAAISVLARGVQPIELADYAPAPQQPVTSCGYGPSGKLWCNHGYVLGYSQECGGRSGSLIITGFARQGDSGGPVLDLQGRLVGIIWGTTGRSVAATGCDRIRSFLQRVLTSGAGSVPVSPRPLVPIQPDVDRPIQQPPEHFLPPPNDQPPKQELQPSLSERLARLEAALELISRLRQRVEEAEKRLGPQNLRAVVREVAAEVLAERAPNLLEQLVPRLVVALGWTGPPALAVVFIARLLAALIRLRYAGKSRNNSRGSASANSACSEQDTKQANPTRVNTPDKNIDAHRAVLLAQQYEEELRQALQDAPATVVAFLQRLRRRVKQRVRRLQQQSTLANANAGAIVES